MYPGKPTMHRLPCMARILKDLPGIVAYGQHLLRLYAARVRYRGRPRTDLPRW